MFTFVILIGIYSYAIFFLGLIGLLYKQYIVLLTILFLLATIYKYKTPFNIILLRCFRTLKRIQSWRKEDKYVFFKQVRYSKLIIFLMGIVILQAGVNLVGALGPELAFDALWYHLTLPKLYLLHHSIFHIPGGLLYYSDLPKLTEMLYILALAFQGEILAKLIHFSFGILISVALYKLSRKFFSQTLSLLVVVVFYSNLVVAWESITAYVDLARTFFEVMALWGFINFVESQKRKWLITSALMLGLAISTKLLAIGSLIIFTSLLIYESIKNNRKDISTVNNILVYWYISALVVLPWLLFSFLNTGNPVYPFFTNTYTIKFNFGLLNPVNFLFDVWKLLTHAADPISPIYLISLPLIFIFLKQLKKEIRLIGLYSLLALLVWYFIPRTGGGRFILPYLGAFSIVTVAVIEKIKNNALKNYVITVIIFISFISIVYRGIANKKYLPFIVGYQSKGDFLSKHLNFSFGDFYDTDSYFAQTIKKKDNVLIYGVHNLYYINFPFIHESYIKRGNKFNYILTQDTELPKQFSNWQIIYKNNTTHVKLYTQGGKKWAY